MGKWPVRQADIKHVQMQLSNFCNLACPSCARTARIKELEHMNNYHMDLDFFKSIFVKGEWPGLRLLSFCGNVDDPTMHPQLFEMMEHILTVNQHVIINVSTNSSTRTPKYYADMGAISAKHGDRVKIIFAIDGLEDTNHLYRINSNWKKIESNWKAFIAAGGYAIWQYVVFDHNKHQIEEARALQKAEGFKAFWLRYSGRVHADKGVNVQTLSDYVANEQVICKSLIRPDSAVSPKLYIDHLGNITPCCYIDLSNMKHVDLYSEILSTVDKTAYSLHHNSADGIMDGPWFDWLYDNFERSPKCINHCKHNFIDKFVKSSNG